MSDTRRTTDLTIHPRADVVPFPDPETHEQMAADVERRGIVVPLDILADGTVLDGRTRLSIARVLGLAEVPVRVVETADPYDYMVRAALMRRDLKPSQKAALSLELPEYRAAKERAKERQREHAGTAPNTFRTDTESVAPPVHAAAVAAQVAGVSTSYVEKADYVRQRDPDLFEQVKAGEVTVDAAKKAVKARENEEDVPQPKATGRIAAPKCDGCGCVLRDDTVKADADREVSVQMTGDLPDKVSALASSIDPHADGRQTYRWRSTSWDLCVPCAGPVYAWLVERLGKPAHDDLGEVMP